MNDLGARRFGIALAVAVASWISVVPCGSAQHGSGQHGSGQHGSGQGGYDFGLEEVDPKSREPSGDETTEESTIEGRTAGASVAADATAEDTSNQESEEVDTTDWEMPRVLLIRLPDTPVELLRVVRRLVQSVGEPVDAASFVRQARARGLRPTGYTAFEQLLRDLDVQLVVVISRVRVGRIPHIKISYREGRSGGILLEELHPVAGDRVTESVSERILTELRLALAVVTRPKGAPAPPPAPEPETREPEEPGSAIRFSVAAGFGVGTRQFEVPSTSGSIRLASTLFPAVAAQLGVGVEPTAQGRWLFGGAIRYHSSAGLETTDERVDGTNRQTSSRAQRFHLVARARYRLGAALSASSLVFELGWMFRFFSSEAPVTLPDYVLQGPTTFAGFRLPLLGQKLVLSVGPEVFWVLLVGDELRGLNVSSFAVGLGGAASVTYSFTDAIAVRARYIENHALLSAPGGRARDVERFVTIGVEYTP